MVAIGTAAGAVESSLEHDAGDLFDSAIAPYENALVNEVDSRSESGGSGSGFSAMAPHSTGEDETRQPTDAFTGAGDYPGSVVPTSTLSLVQWALILLSVSGFAALASRYRSRLWNRREAIDRQSVTKRNGQPKPGIPYKPGDPVGEIWLQFAREVATDRLQTKTTTEIAQSAIDSGMDPTSVRELTGVFEEVEYGGRPITEARLCRARDARDRLTGGETRDE